MMMAASNLTKKLGIPILVSLDAIMVDGTGMCGACRVTVGGKTRFTCVDGPEFDGHQVDFKEMMHHLRLFNSCEVRAKKFSESECQNDQCIKKKRVFDDKE